MSSVKSQTKWVTKYFASILLVLLVAYALVAYFTSKVSVSNFITAAFVAVVVLLIMTYFSLVNVRAALTFVVLAVVLVAGVVFGDRPNVNAGQFQSVTLVSGQTYFGHLTNLNSQSATLTDVYSLQAQQTPSTTDSKTTTTKPIL